MKKKILLFAESLAFVALVVALLMNVSFLMERKASRNQFGPFLEDPEAYDVLFFGDSRMVNAVFPMELWDDYGVAGYNLSCYGNTMPITYWSVINALDYADPQLAVICTNGLGKDLKLTGSSSDVHTAFDFYPLSRNKIRAIEDLMDDPDAMDDDGNRYVDMKWEYYFTLGKYHSRWNELALSDWKPAPSAQNGAEMVVDVAPLQAYELIEPDQYADEWGCGYSYLRRTIEECQRRGIDVLLVTLPYPASAESQMEANTVGSIAEEYGVTSLDMIALDSIVDYATDCYDLACHLNPSGARKVSTYLGDYLAEHYALPDRRADAGYEGWAARGDAYLDHKLSLIRAQDDLRSTLMLLHDPDFGVRMAIHPQAQLYYDDTAILLMHNIAREQVVEQTQYSAWSNAMYPLAGFDEALWEGVPYVLEMDGGAANELLGDAAVAAAQAAGIDVFGADASAQVRIQVIDLRDGSVAVEKAF